jgi:hypothetical protein
MATSTEASLREWRYPVKFTAEFLTQEDEIRGGDAPETLPFQLSTFEGITLGFEIDGPQIPTHRVRTPAL